MGCHALLQGIFLTQGSNLHLLMTLALAGGFFTASATWEARNMSTTPLKSIFRGKGALTFFVFHLLSFKCVSFTFIYSDEIWILG